MCNVNWFLHKTQYFHTPLGVARIPWTLPLMEIARTIISFFWLNCQLSLNAKGGGILCVCRQPVFQNGQPVENTLQKGPESPLQRSLPFLFLMSGKRQESLKLMATDWKRKGNQRNIYSLRSSSLSFTFTRSKNSFWLLWFLWRRWR